MKAALSSTADKSKSAGDSAETSSRSKSAGGSTQASSRRGREGGRGGQGHGGWGFDYNAGTRESFSNAGGWSYGSRYGRDYERDDRCWGKDYRDSSKGRRSGADGDGKEP